MAKKKFYRFLSLVAISAMIATTIPSTSVYAAEVDEGVVQQTAVEAETQQAVDEADVPETEELEEAPVEQTKRSAARVAIMDEPYFEYTGEPIEPSLTVLDFDVPEGEEPFLYEGIDYDIEYSNNVEFTGLYPKSGMGTAHLIFKDRYEGEKYFHFYILYEPFFTNPLNEIGKPPEEEPIEEPVIEPEQVTPEITYIEELVYTGYPVEPEVIVQAGDKVLEKGVDYDVEYVNNINVTSGGEAPRVIVRCKGEYNDVLEQDFTIKPADLAGEDVIFDNPYDLIINQTEPWSTGPYNAGTRLSITYKGQSLREEYYGRYAWSSIYYDTKYKLGKDGELFSSIERNMSNDDGTYYIVLTGKGNFTGTVELPLDIVPYNEWNIVRAVIPERKAVWDWSTKKVTLNLSYKFASDSTAKYYGFNRNDVVPLTQGVDYDVTMVANVKCLGMGLVKITGKGMFLGERYEIVCTR